MRTKYQPHFIHLRNHAQFLQEIAKQPIMQKKIVECKWIHCKSARSIDTGKSHYGRGSIMCYKSQIFLGFLNLILLFILIRNAMWTRNIFFTLWIELVLFQSEELIMWIIHKRALKEQV